MSSNDPTDVRLSVEARGRRLKSLRKMADLSRKTLTQKYQISSSTLQAWEEGKSGGLTEKGANRIIMALRGEGVCATTQWLLKGVGQAPYLSERVYLGAKETEGELFNNVTMIDADIIAKELNVFRQLNKDVLDMVIFDDGMYPFYKKGDTIAGKRFSGDKIETALGHDCIIETKTGEILCRRIRKSPKKSYYNLQCIYLEASVEEPLRYEVALLSAAPIIWHRRPK